MRPSPTSTFLTAAATDDKKRKLEADLQRWDRLKWQCDVYDTIRELGRKVWLNMLSPIAQHTAAYYLNMLSPIQYV